MKDESVSASELAHINTSMSILIKAAASQVCSVAMAFFSPKCNSFTCTSPTFPWANAEKLVRHGTKLVTRTQTHLILTGT